MNTIRLRALGVLLCAATAIGLLLSPLSPLGAQSSDTWSGHIDKIGTCSTSISSSAAVIAAVSGKVINVRAMTLRSSGAGVVVFQDGSSGTTIANIYLEADKPYTIYENQFGGGLKTTSGTGLYAVLSGATLTAIVRYQLQ